MFEASHVITDLAGRFVEADDAYCRALHLTAAELCRRDVLSITHRDDRPRNDAALRELADRGTPFWIRKRYLRDDGSSVWVLNYVSPLVGITGRTRIAATCFPLPPSLCGDGAEPVAMLSLARGRLC